MIRIRHNVPWIMENWKCTFSDADPPYEDFSFSITGSVTGNDGTGNGTKDFRSNSGRVIIKGGDTEKGGDWHLNRSFRVLKTIVKNGDSVTWKTFSISRDYFSGHEQDWDCDNEYVLFQGIPNANHLLKLKKTGKRVPEIKEITVYRPLLNK
jgi:hypothetical protein